MKVLALGLPRSGTESLRHALFTLGYKHVYHGFDAVANPSDSVVWVELWDKKCRGLKLTAADFDRVLGHCEAVTELPGCIFAQELIQAYPDAKIIINYRESIDAWHQSIINTWSKSELGLGGRLCFWNLCWLNPSLFWLGRQHVAITENGFLQRDYRNTAKPFYHKHYTMLDEVEKSRPSQCLKWSVEHGWDSLCTFLGKPVPKEPFPHAHAQDAASERAIRLLKPRCYWAIFNLCIIICALYVGCCWLGYFLGVLLARSRLI